MGTQGRRWLVALVVAVLLTVACTRDDDDDGVTVITDPVESTSSTSSTSSTTSTTSTTTDPQAEVKAEVEAAYLAYWDAWLEIFAEPNPENPLIDQHTTATVREVTLDAISEDILNGTSTRPPENPDDFEAGVLGVTMEGSRQATVRACLVDGAVAVKNATGEILDDDIVTLLLEAILIKEDGRWKVAGSTVLEEREGRWTCTD